MRFKVLAIFIIGILYLSLQNSFAQINDEKLLDEIAEESCKCLQEVDLEKDLEKANEFLENCLQNSMVEHLQELMAYQSDNEQEGEKMAMEVAKILFKNCPKFVDFSLKIAEADQQGNLADFYTEGTLIELQKKELVYLIVNDAGQEKRFLCLRPFNNSEEIILNFETYKGKFVKIGWNILEFFDPSQNAYATTQEIISLRIIE